MSSEPVDPIETALRAAPAELWDQLFEATHAFLAESEHSTWAGGDQIDTTVVDGEERPVFEMPYVLYSDTVRRIISLLDWIGVVHPFDWPHWEQADRYRGGSALRSAPVGDAARMATVIVRSDRFCEGSIAAAIDDGTLAAVLDRLLRWYDSQR
jgi:hypothetical protein